jgi:hypothetical protein
MEWNKILENKKQTNYFSDDPVDEQLIVDILQELHDYCPSKQNETPYKITVIPNKGNIQLKEEIFYDSWCFSKKLSDPRNTQVLAPYTLMFKSTTDHNIGLIEIGIASLFIAYAAIDKGLSIGFCECIKRSEVDLILGLGYTSTTPTYLDPLRKRHLKKRPTDEPEVPKQSIETYISWL